MNIELEKEEQKEEGHFATKTKRQRQISSAENFFSWKLSISGS
jgi:hypothetical protein